MSSGDPARGITCPDMRRVVREALSAGWVWDGWTGTTHAAIRWPATGARVTFGSTPGVASWKSLATEIRKASGVVVWRKGNRKRSRKPVETSGFDLTHARSESLAWHHEHDPEIAALMDRRDMAISRARAAARRRHTIRKVPEMLAEIEQIEARLAAFGQAVEKFDPMTLADA